MNKEEFLKKYKGKAIHCPTEELANEFLRLCDKFDIKWQDRKKATENNYWKEYKSDICYDFENGHVEYCDLGWYKSNNYEIIEFQPPKKNKLIITYTDKELTIQKDNKTATAKLHPEDKFDLLTGIKIALDKLNKKEITEDEKVILRNIDKKYKWIARDASGNLYIYVNKPKKGYWGYCDWNLCEISEFNHLFQNIQWEDTKPTYIPDLLGDNKLKH